MLWASCTGKLCGRSSTCKQYGQADLSGCMAGRISRLHGPHGRHTCRAASSPSAMAGAGAWLAAGRAGFLAAGAARAGAGRLVFLGDSACTVTRSTPAAWPRQLSWQQTATTMRTLRNAQQH